MGAVAAVFFAHTPPSLSVRPALNPSMAWAVYTVMASPVFPPRPIGSLLLSANQETGLKTHFPIVREENQRDNSKS